MSSLQAFRPFSHLCWVCSSLNTLSFLAIKTQIIVKFDHCNPFQKEFCSSRWPSMPQVDHAPWLLRENPSGQMCSTYDLKPTWALSSWCCQEDPCSIGAGSMGSLLEGACAENVAVSCGPISTPPGDNAPWRLKGDPFCQIVKTSDLGATHTLFERKRFDIATYLVKKELKLGESFENLFLCY